MGCPAVADPKMSMRHDILTMHTVPLASNHHGPRRLTILRRRLLPRDPLPNRLPIQATEGQLHHSHLPPEHQQQRQHLLGHSERSVEPRTHHFQRCVMTILPFRDVDTEETYLDGHRTDMLIILFHSAPIHLLDAHRPQPRRPAGARDCTRLQDRPL